MDQAVFLSDLSAVFQSAGLEIVSFETYVIWTKDDYQFFVVRKKSEFKEVILSEKRTVLQKGIIKLKRMVRALFYSYPKK